jgi:hypothetical protein
LKPSGRRVAWFEIPESFEEQNARPRHHYFVSRAPIELSQLREYLGTRMLSGEVQEWPLGTRYVNVMPLSAEADAMHFDVRIGEIDQGRGLSLSLEERTFYTPPPSVQDVAKQLAQERSRAE